MQWDDIKRQTKKWESFKESVALDNLSLGEVKVLQFDDGLTLPANYSVARSPDNSWYVVYEKDDQFLFGKLSVDEKHTKVNVQDGATKPSLRFYDLGYAIAYECGGYIWLYENGGSCKLFRGDNPKLIRGFAEEWIIVYEYEGVFLSRCSIDDWQSVRKFPVSGYRLLDVRFIYKEQPYVVVFYQAEDWNIYPNYIYATIWRDFTITEETEEDWLKGKLDALITESDGLTIPKEYSIALSPDTLLMHTSNRVWVVYRNYLGEIVLARADEKIQEWEFSQTLFYVPSGSVNPSLVFDKSNRYVVAAEFVPAGSSTSEIWLYNYPYSGGGIRHIVDGQHPLLAKDRHGNIFLFYQTIDRCKIEYRKDLDNFAEAYEPTENDLANPYPVGFRTLVDDCQNYLEYRYAFFTRSKEEELPRYLLTEKVMEMNLLKDNARGNISLALAWSEYAFYITLEFIDIFTHKPLVGATVSFRGHEYITAQDGKIHLGKVAGYPNDEILVSHPDYPDTTFEFQIREDRNFVFEILGDFTLKDETSGNANIVGIEWEHMVNTIDFLVYSSFEDVFVADEFIHTLNHYKTGSSQSEALIWQDQGQSTDQDVIVEFHTEGEKRPGVALRCGGSSSSENLYVGVSRYSNGTIEIAKYVNGSYAQLASKSSNLKQDKRYKCRFQALGTSLKLKFWEADQDEPANWDLETTDSSISTGYAGVYMFDGEGKTSYANFSLNGETADWKTSDGKIPTGWALQFGTSSRWSTSVEERGHYERIYDNVQGATLKIEDQEALTNAEGIVGIPYLTGGEFYNYTLTHPDYDWVTEGRILIPKDDEVIVPLQIYNDPPSNHLKDFVDGKVDIGIEWIDARYEVTIIALDHETGQALIGSEVLFNGKTKLTDNEGKATFEKVLPYPTVTNYEVVIDGSPKALIRVTGHEDTRKIIVPIQVGAETMPHSLKEYTDGSADVKSILWVEV